MSDLKDLIVYTNKLNILYADDDPFIRKAVSKFFKNIFNEVTIVEDGTEAIEKYKSNKYDIIFLDINMPKMDGLEVGKYIKEHDIAQKVVFITAFDEVEYIKKAMEINADEYIYKPIKEEEFINKIISLVN
jgi:CheY-like chemotaxis protein